MLQLLEAIGEVGRITGNGGEAVYPRGGKEQISLRSFHDPRLLEIKYRWEYRLFSLGRTPYRLILGMTLVLKANYGGPCRDRTCDHLIKSQSGFSAISSMGTIQSGLLLHQDLVIA